ncbi:MAG: helix-turn-helix transcriptional regulator [Candidatus Falkowbacteria bacterium]|nr:helix-turn-helix transcriptional regulator [Candidatus Falkowbacteria bacterium]
MYQVITIIINMNNQNINLPIGNCLKECRQKVGLSQFDVMISLGFKSNNRLSQWENGHRLPGIINLFRLADIYQVTPQELYPDMKSRNPIPPQD